MPKALILEPNIDLLTCMADALENEGFKVSGSTTSTQGLDIARILRPDIIILDYKLAEEDNYRLLSILNNDQSTAAARVIVNTDKKTNYQNDVKNEEIIKLLEGKINRADKKYQIYIDAVRAIWADKIINEEEETFLINKAILLEISQMECNLIENAIIGFPKELATGLENGAHAYILKPSPNDLGTFITIIHAQIAKKKELQGVEETVQRLIEILDCSIDIVAVTDIKLENLFYLNQQGRDLLHINGPKEIQFQGFQECKEAQETMNSLRKCFPAWTIELLKDEGIPIAIKSGSWKGETALITQDGREIPTSQLIQVHKNSKGNVGYISTIIRDITEIKKKTEELSIKEQELRETNQRFNKLAANVPGVIFQMSRLNKSPILFPYMSPACEGFFGHSFEEIEENPNLFLSLIHPEDAENFYKSMEVSSKQKRPLFWEGRIQIKDRTIWLNCLARPEELGDGSILWDGILTDSTARKTAEKERDFMEIQLRHGQKLESIGQLAAGVAHEINTPVQYVGDNIRFIGDYFKDLGELINKLLLLHKSCLSNKKDEKLISNIDKFIGNLDLDFLLEEIPLAIKQSLEGVSSVSKIVQSMKDFSHPGTAKKIHIDLNNIIASTITVSRNEWKYVAEMEKNFDLSLPPVWCLPDEFNQAMLNLILNACHAIQDKEGENSSKLGKIAIKTYHNKSYAFVEISDSGIGIKKEIHNKIFDPFFTTKKVGKGTGQGLAIAHSVIKDKHDGTIEFQSDFGQGTTFIIKIPIDPLEKTSNN